MSDGSGRNTGIRRLLRGHTRAHAIAGQVRFRGGAGSNPEHGCPTGIGKMPSPSFMERQLDARRARVERQLAKHDEDELAEQVRSRRLEMDHA